MRIHQIFTVAGAAILSLGAILVLEQGDRSAPATPEAAGVAFTDTSSLVEYALPAPTAEPPATPEAPVAAEPSNPTDEAAPAVSVEAPEVAEATPAENTPTPGTIAGITDDRVSPADDEIAPGLPGTATITITPAPAGSEPTEKSGGSISDTFMKAVAAATDSAETTDAAGETTGDSIPQPSIIEETPDGFWLRSAKLNDVFQHLAQIGNFQYFHNTELDGPNFVVTGQLMNGNPVEQMEEIALMFGVTIHQKGNTVYALNSAQLSQLPTEPFRYQLKYLRPKDIEQIKIILQPFLTPGSGIIEFEPKTNTLIVMDNARKIEALSTFLEQIDLPKQQIAIETRILRVSSSSANRVGVDWSSVLGKNGTTINAAQSLNALFNLPDLATSAAFSVATDDGNPLNNASVSAAGAFRDADELGGSGALVLAPVQLTAVLRALNERDLANQESSPTLIAEDNEEGLISIIDRIPIITSTVTITDGSQNVTDEVRYKIDEADPTGDPATTREVGVSVSVTPTILPDNTIRMALRPRTAQVTEYVTSPSGNLYPRVNESTVTTTARVPNGHSLLIGGFYEEIEGDVRNKVPILGDIPAVNLLFKSSTTERKNTSLVFIVTPKLYRPNVTMESDLVSHEIHDSHVLPVDHDSPDPRNPGDSVHPNLRNTLANAFNAKKNRAPTSMLLPEHPYNRPEALPTVDDYSEPQFVPVGDRPEVTVRPAGNKKNGGFLGKMFGGNKKHP